MYLLAATIQLDPSLIVSLLTIAGAVWGVVTYIHQSRYLLEKSISNTQHELRLTEQKIIAALQMVEHRLKCLEEFQEETTSFQRRKCKRPDQTGGRWLDNFVNGNGD